MQIRHSSRAWVPHPASVLQRLARHDGQQGVGRVPPGLIAGRALHAARACHPLLCESAAARSTPCMLLRWVPPEAQASGGRDTNGPSTAHKCTTLVEHGPDACHAATASTQSHRAASCKWLYSQS